MNACSQDILISPYHDGQLDAQRRADVEDHLAGCAQCQKSLAELRSISALIAKAPLQSILPIEQLRMHRTVDSVQVQLGERAVLRIATSLAAIAASVLLVTSLCLAANFNGIHTDDGPAARGGVAGPSVEQARSNLSGWMVRSLGGDTP